VARASGAEQARRVNLTVSLLQHGASASKVLACLVARWGLSRRQASRYLRRARQTAGPLPIPEGKAVFTVKLPLRLIRQVRRQARRERSAISGWVERALQQALGPP
jgi:hypothetical protein